MCGVLVVRYLHNVHGPRQCGLAVCFCLSSDVRMLVGVVHMKPFLTLMTWPLTMNAPSAHVLAMLCVW